MSRTIEAFDANGNRLRRYSQHSIEYYLALGRVAVTRNLCGAIVRATFLPSSNRQTPIAGRKTLHRGTRYSRQKQVGDVRLWQHRAMPDSREPFRAVEYSVTVQAQKRVVSIDSLEKASTQPVEITLDKRRHESAAEQDKKQQR